MNALARTVMKAPILSYQSHLTLSSLAQDHWTHGIQATLTYL